MNKSYKVKVPKGKKVLSKEDKGNDIIIHLADIIKDGDVCYMLTMYNEYIFIFKEDDKGEESPSYYICMHDTDLTYNDTLRPDGIRELRLATDKEKQSLIDMLGKENKVFNFETKQLSLLLSWKKDTRWRAEEGDKYECILVDGDGVRIAKYKEFGGLADDDYFNSGNYYNPADHDKTADKAKRISEILKE